MAEVVGLVASVIAIGQVATAVGKAVVRLKSLWDQVDDVPEQISDLLEELQLLDPMLKGIDKQLSLNSLPKEVWAHSSTKSSRDYCQKAMDSLYSLANDLDQDITKSRNKLRKLGKVGKKLAFTSATLQKDAIERHEKKLERAMRLLKMSMECHAMAMNYEILRSHLTQATPKFEVIVQVSPADAGPKALVEDGDVGRPKSPSETLWKPFRRRPAWSSYFGSVTYSSSASGRTYRIRFHVPKWLKRRIWEFESRRSYGGWQQISIRVYNTRRLESRIFRLTYEHRNSDMLEMFNKGEASPFDCDPYGRSLLHYATLPCSIDTCKLLLDCGLGARIDEQYTSDITKSPRVLTLIWDFSYAGILWASYHTDLGQLKAKIEIMDLFWKYDYEESSASNGRAGISGWEYGWGNEFLAQIQCQGASSYHTLPLRFRLSAIRNNVYRPQWDSYKPESLKYLISKDCNITTEDIAESVREGVSLIHTCALALGSMSKIPPNWKFCEWNEFVREVISASTTDELHTVEECTIGRGNWIGTPLVSLFQGLAVLPREQNHWIDCFGFGLRNWLEQVKKCGIDLVQYGQREKAHLERHLTETGERVQVTFDLKDATREERKYPMELCDIKFGPEPADWIVIWSLDVCQMAGEFFEMVEPQPASVPSPCEANLKSDSTTPGLPGQWVD